MVWANACGAHIGPTWVWDQEGLKDSPQGLVRPHLIYDKQVFTTQNECTLDLMIQIIRMIAEPWDPNYDYRGLYFMVHSNESKRRSHHVFQTSRPILYFKILKTLNKDNWLYLTWVACFFLDKKRRKEDLPQNMHHTRGIKWGPHQICPNQNWPLRDGIGLWPINWWFEREENGQWSLMNGPQHTHPKWDPQLNCIFFLRTSLSMKTWYMHGPVSVQLFIWNELSRWVVHGCLDP